MISFGPVPSRRLGKSLGINNITPQKVCSYSCVYCQVGLTKKFSSVRQIFYAPEIIYEEVRKHLEKLKPDDKPDYLTFVASGEPTLDLNLGKAIEKLKTFNIPIALITNASLLSDSQVRDEIKIADWVSVKIDAGNQDVWKKINHPDRHINFEKYKEGLLTFSKEYTGKLLTETMLVKGINNSEEILGQIAELVAQVAPSTAYIAIPTRPPAMNSVIPATGEAVNRAYQLFSGKNLNTELILGFEGTDTGFTGNALEDIMNICSVHPIREDQMIELLKKDMADPTILDMLIFNNYIQKLEYKSNIFYLRKFKS